MATKGWIIEWDEGIKSYHYFVYYKTRWARTTWASWEEVATKKFTYDQCYRMVQGTIATWKRGERGH